MATSTIRALKIIRRSYTLEPVNSTYTESTTDMSYSGYIPISLGWKSNQVNTAVYRAEISGNNIIIGRYNPSGLNSNTLQIFVTYIGV